MTLVFRRWLGMLRGITRIPTRRHDIATWRRIHARCLRASVCHGCTRRQNRGSDGTCSIPDLIRDSRPTGRHLSSAVAGVAYVELSNIKTSDVPAYFERAKSTKGLIVDIRNYPSAFMPFVMGAYLAVKPTAFVNFTFPDLANPSAFRFGGGPLIQPGPSHYGGKVVILVDETTQSSAEYTAMALRAMPNAVVVGSTTAGADGDVSAISLPGGLSTMISGLGVFYPDHRPTQRVGDRAGCGYPAVGEGNCRGAG